jgi:predicted metal-dependent hydrolase
MNKKTVNYYIRYFLRPRRRSKKIVKRPSVKYLKYKEQTRLLVSERLIYWNNFYNFTYKKVFIKNQKTRWGSCSKQGNLNFSYKLVFLPKRLVDYIIVHELCHLGEFNHSVNFWKLVEKTIPNYIELKHELKVMGSRYTSVKDINNVNII